MLNELRLTSKAKAGLKSISSYSRQNFGVKQMENYLAKIDKGFMLLLSEPEIGVKRDEIKKGYYSFVVEKHIIFYRSSSNKIEVIGITSGKMDIKSHYNTTRIF